MNPLVIKCIHRLSSLPFLLIHAIFAWAEDRVSIPSSGFGISDKLADAKHVPLVYSEQMHPLLIHLCTKRNIETVITEKLITSGAS
jgi:hypothetical protein